MIRMDSDKAKEVFHKQLVNLDDYVCSSKIMDERTYRNTFMEKGNPIAFVQHHHLGGNFDIYRSRMGDSIKPEEDITNPSTFSYIPHDKCTGSFPKIQRCNFSGQSVFYASMSLRTNFREIDKDCCSGKVVYISVWHIDKSAKTNLYRVIPPEGVDYAENYKGILKLDKDIKHPPYVVDYMRKIGEIFMNTEGESEKYLPCALISNYIYAFRNAGSSIFEGQDLIYHGILYPSVKEKDRCSLNVALTTDFVDKYVNLKYVIKGVVNEDLTSVNFENIGFCHDNTIIWYSISVPYDSIKPTNFWLLDKDEHLHTISNGHLYDKNHKEVSDPYFAFYADMDQWMEQMLNLIVDQIDINTIVAESSFEKITNDKVIVRDLDGWTLEYENESIEIIEIVYEFEYKTSLEKTT